MARGAYLIVIVAILAGGLAGFLAAAGRISAQESPTADTSEATA